MRTRRRSGDRFPDEWNTKLKMLLAEAMLDTAILGDVAAREW
jgi:hypothetical protein